MFEELSQKLEGALRALRGQGHLTEENVGESLREVRRALLDADVNIQVARDFVERVREKALGQEVLHSLQPGQHVVKIVYEEIVALLGGQTADLVWGNAHPSVILLAGLQGSGKTTFAAKLARHLARRGRKPLLVAADIYRPAAVEQLEILGRQVEVPVYARAGETNVPRIVEQGRAQARELLRDTLIVDTAGRLHIDTELMQELEAICRAVPPSEVLLVVDAMTGQEAVHVAQEFDARLSLTGVALTKLDGDARGGAALSLRTMLGKPIKFVGVGEGLDDLEPFHPDRMAQRILGMGDMLTLIEKAQETYDEDEARTLEKKLRRQTLTLEDFLEQLQHIKRMGPLDKLLGMVPGMTPAMMSQTQVEPRQLNRVQGIVHSMTPQERRNPQVIDGSRRRRIARGSGTSVQEVNLLLKQFDQMKRMMKSMSSKSGLAAARSMTRGGVSARFTPKKKRRKR